MPWKFLSIQLSLISMLALVSGYPAPDLSQGNWDTTLFLTPYGIINNHLHKDTSVLWTFYSDISSGNLELSLVKMGLMAVIYVLLALSAISYLRTQKG